MEKEINNQSKIYNILLIILPILIIIAIGIILFEPKNFKKKELEINASGYIFVGETKEINVKTSETPVALIYKNGYLKSEKNTYYETENKILITALKAGNEEIEFKTENMNKKVSILVCSKLNLSDKTISLMVESTENLSFNISQECLSKYNFLIEDSDIAAYENGIVVAKRVGTTKLNISRENEKYTYTIKVQPKELKFLNPISKINVGEDYILKVANVVGTLKCTSSNSNFSIVSNKDSCQIEAKNPGSATITASSDGKKVKTTITVIQPVESISFNEDKFYVRQGEQINANITIRPSNATDKTLKCSSSNTKIATVSTSGTKCVIKGVKVGNAKITATASGKTTTTSIEVTEPVTAINLKVATWNLGRYGKTSQSSASIQANYFKLQNIDIAGFQEVRPYSGSMTVPLNTYVSVTGLGHYRYHETPAGNAVLSKYAIKSAQNKSLTSCSEARGLTKVVIQVNGIDISFYTTHFSYQSNCHKIHAESLANLIKDDPNPQIITGDFNIHNNDVLTPALGNKYKIVAYDNVAHYYTDSILIKATDSTGKIRLRIKNYDVLKTDGIYTDHNMVVANIEVLN